MHIDLSVLADAATVDRSGKLNILGIFDEIAATAYPAQHERLAVVLRFLAFPHEVGTYPIRVVLVDADGRSLMEAVVSLEVPEFLPGMVGPAKVPLIVNVSGLLFQEPGEYALDVFTGSQQLASLPLSVSQPAGQLDV